MILTESGNKYFGIFEIDKREISGDLEFAGNNTNLTLHHSSFFRPNANPDRCVHGVLRDLTKVSLFDCIGPEIPGASYSVAGSYNFAKLEPHFVFLGQFHLRPEDDSIKSINVILEDSNSIFADYETFSSAFYPPPEQLSSLIPKGRSNGRHRPTLGRNSAIAYFTGKLKIFSHKTEIGTVSANHSPTFRSGNSSGVSITNEIYNKIKFERSVIFAKSIQSILIYLQFLQILSGRRQNIKRMWVELKGKSKIHPTLEVFWCHPPRRGGTDDKSKLSVMDLPIDACRNPKYFGNVLKEWISRHSERKMARGHFSACFAKENTFDIDRLIGAANMFDLLPLTALPDEIELSDDLRVAQDTCRKIFKNLPCSEQRNEILSALARVTRPNLKRKVLHRASPVINELHGRLPNLEDVLKLAVDARNYYVHGGTTKIDYETKFIHTIPFLTRSLEFVFAASELLEAGWDLKKWKAQGSTLSHPFGSYVFLYHENFGMLQEALPEGHRLK